jgi:GTP-binding protein Era
MEFMDSSSLHRAGFVGILGAPNAGKSTLLNTFLGEKVAITSAKPQTTRHRILGVSTRPEAQAIFFDTPGVHRAKNLLGRELVAQALSVIGDADVLLLVVDAEHPSPEDDLVIEHLEGNETPVFLALNKIDRVSKPNLLPLIDGFNRRLPLAAIVPVSAKTGENTEILLKEIIGRLPEGPEYYPPDTLTDQPERFIAAEMIREQVFRRTGQEVPYATAVTVEAFKEEEGLIRISSVIHVERDSQKNIVIGKGGLKLKEIGTAARMDIERMTGTKVFLEMFVRVEKNWTRDPKALRRFGYVPE